jgi:hypothetical protein
MLRHGFRPRAAALVVAAALRRRSARCAGVLALAAVAQTLAPAARAQGPTLPPGFAAHVAFADAAQVPFVRAVVALDDGHHLLVHRGALHLVRDHFAPSSPATSPPLLQLPNEDIAFVALDGGVAVVGGLRSGRVLRYDLAARALTGAFVGVRNTFDVVVLPGGDLLLAANPTWPAAGANSGIWLAGPGRTPRELLQLVGPSGPLVLDAAGDLIVAELGAIVPPPPGAARLLRVPAARLQQALAGGALAMGDVAAIGGGYAGIYDLACSPDGRLFVADPASSVVSATAPGALAPALPWLDVGSGFTATSLQFVGSAAGPFCAFLPPERASELRVQRTDFWSLLEVVRVRPVRPVASIAPSPTVAPGTSTLHLHGGPANGLCLWLASLPATGVEQIVWSRDGTPLWLGLPPGGAVPFALVALDANGAATARLVNAGGVAGALTVQAVALGPTAGELGSAERLQLQLLP